MARMVQVKGVPDEVHRVLKARAALRGQTLSDYLRAEMTRLAARPSPDELMAMLNHDAPAELGRSAAADVRRSRERAA
jgi:plasmid stability protein